MGMRGHVGRDAIHEGGEVSAVIQVEAAQVILIGLAVPTVLRHDQPGTNSSTSAGRSVGRLSMSLRVTAPLLAASALPTALL